MELKGNLLALKGGSNYYFLGGYFGVFCWLHSYLLKDLLLGWKVFMDSQYLLEIFLQDTGSFGES